MLAAQNQARCIGAKGHGKHGSRPHCSQMQVRAEQFKFFAEALKSAKLKLYVPHFVREAEVRSSVHMHARSGALPCSMLG